MTLGCRSCSSPPPLSLSLSLSLSLPPSLHTELEINNVIKRSETNQLLQVRRWGKSYNFSNFDFYSFSGVSGQVHSHWELLHEGGAHQGYWILHHNDAIVLHATPTGDWDGQLQCWWSHLQYGWWYLLCTTKMRKVLWRPLTNFCMHIAMTPYQISSPNLTTGERLPVLMWMGHVQCWTMPGNDDIIVM